MKITSVVDARGIIGNYVIERELGRGGMGVVYAAKHRVLGRPAAIKLLLANTSEDRGRVERFFNEARAAMAIDHPGVVKIYDVGISAENHPYIAMELLDGTALASLVSPAGLPIRQAVDYACQIASALAAAHDAGVIHRDLKPENIIISRDRSRAIVVDFGIAKLAHQATVRTATGALVGTPLYMSPEQCEGLRDLDARSDLYAFGCVIFAMVTGRPPFFEGGTGGLIGMHLHVAPPPLRSRCANASEALERVVSVLLAKSPDARFRTARATLAALQAPEVRGLAANATGVPATADMVQGNRSVLPWAASPSVPVSHEPMAHDAQTVGAIGAPHPYASGWQASGSQASGTHASGAHPSGTHASALQPSGSNASGANASGAPTPGTAFGVPASRDAWTQVTGADVRDPRTGAVQAVGTPSPSSTVGAPSSSSIGAPGSSAGSSIVGAPSSSSIGTPGSSSSVGAPSSISSAGPSSSYVGVANAPPGGHAHAPSGSSHAYAPSTSGQAHAPSGSGHAHAPSGSGHAHAPSPATGHAPYAMTPGFAPSHPAMTPGIAPSHPGHAPAYAIGHGHAPAPHVQSRRKLIIAIVASSALTAIIAIVASRGCGGTGGAIDAGVATGSNGSGSAIASNLNGSASVNHLDGSAGNRLDGSNANGSNANGSGNGGNANGGNGNGGNANGSGNGGNANGGNGNGGNANGGNGNGGNGNGGGDPRGSNSTAGGGAIASNDRKTDGGTTSPPKGTGPLKGTALKGTPKGTSTDTKGTRPTPKDTVQIDPNGGSLPGERPRNEVPGAGIADVPEAEREKVQAQEPVVRQEIHDYFLFQRGDHQATLGQRALDRVAANHRLDPTRRIVITGHAEQDEPGVLDTLAGARANTAYTHLVNRGVPRSVLVVSSTRYIDPATPNGANRRVNIDFE